MSKRAFGVRSLLVPLLAALTVSLVGMPAALAAAPTITSFAPTCGPSGTQVVIEGNGFQDAPSPVSDVTFGGTAATTFTVNSNTQITATVPAGAATGKIAVTDSEGTATSTDDFVVGALPCIASFTPATGNAGTVVMIVGNGFTGATSVSFGGVAATTFTVDTDTRITATVPANAVTGPIAVVTAAGTGTSATNFTVTTEQTTHARNVTLHLRKHLIARGRVTSDLADCVDGVRIKIQRKRHSWKTVKSGTTTDTGGYRVELRDRPGRYRTIVPATDVGPNDRCLKGRSPVVVHQR